MKQVRKYTKCTIRILCVGLELIYKYILYYVCMIYTQVTAQTATISLGGQSSESPQPTASVPTHIPAGELDSIMKLLKNIDPYV